MPMTRSEAADYAPQWGSYMTSGDPGACMYGLDDKGRPADAESRDAMVAYIDEHCLPIARERIESGTAEDDDADDVEQLEALKTYLTGFTFPERHTIGDPIMIGNVNVADFVEHYVTAMLWATTDESGDDDSGGVPMDQNYDANDVAPSAMADIEADCRAFITAAGDLISADNFQGRDKSGYIANAGHDFFLTRCGHGAGFWDGDWKSDERNGLQGPLTRLAKDAGEVWPCVGDDGLIYHT